MVHPFRRVCLACCPTVAICCGMLCLVAGCRTTTTNASIALWHPPIAVSAVGKNVRIEPIIGPPKLASAIQQAMLQSPPNDVARTIAVQDSKPKATIALVSATDEPVSVAPADFILRGEVLPPTKTAIVRGDAMPALQPIRMTWRVLRGDANGNAVESIGGVAMKVEPEVSLIPDSSIPKPIAEARQEKLIRRAAEKSFALVTPSVRRETVALVSAGRWRGGKAIDLANEAAANGDWLQASQMYRDILTIHPSRHQAAHNLAIAEVAAQRFEEARQLIRKAMQSSPSNRYQSTMAWIETAYRNHQLAFGLPYVQ